MSINPFILHRCRQTVQSEAVQENTSTTTLTITHNPYMDHHDFGHPLMLKVGANFGKANECLIVATDGQK